MFKLVKYSKDNFNEWNDFLLKSKNGLFLFNRDFMDYHKDRFTDHSLIIYKKEKAYALFPANEKGEMISSHAGLTFGSLIIDLNAKTNEVLEILELIINYYRSYGIKELTYKAIPYIFHRYPSQEDLYALFINNATIFRRDISSVIDLKNPIKFSESKKQAITKCIKQDIKVKQIDDYTEYWKLLTKVLRKFDTKPVHTLSEIALLQKRFPESILLFGAFKDVDLIAGILLFDFGQVIHTQYMANSDEGRKIGALDFVNYTIIEKYKGQKNYYSFGISTEQNGKYLNTGLIQQKEMMGARSITLDFYKINLNH